MKPKAVPAGAWAGAGQVRSVTEEDALRRYSEITRLAGHLGDPPALEPQRAPAQRLDRDQVVTHEQHGAVLPRHIADLAEAFLLERRIADRQDLVDEQDLGLEMRGNGEGQPKIHPARVALHRRVDESFDLGEVDDLVELLAISRRRIPRIAPLRKMFSRPVSSPWKPVPTSRREPTRP